MKNINNITIAIYLCLCLFLLQIASNLVVPDAIQFESNFYEKPVIQRTMNQKLVSSNYQPNEIIYINGNTDFANQVASGNWSGSGTAGDPYLFTGYKITGTGSENLIDIRNTDVYFTLLDVFVHDGKNGIYLSNVLNGNITNVISSNNTDGGFYLSVSSNNTLNYNKAFDNTYQGFSLVASSNNTLNHNSAFDNGDPGFYSWDSNNNTIINNLALNNGHSGINLRSSNDTMVLGNTIQNHPTGIELNSAYYPPRNSENNTIRGNTISDNNVGISLTADTRGNVIERNTFINNDNGATDANPDGGETANRFLNNYWSDWTEPDVDGDLIVDVPYTITGAAGNQDPYPLVLPPGSPFVLSPPLDLTYFAGSQGPYSLTWLPIDDNPTTYVISQNDALVRGPLPWTNNTAITIDVTGLAEGVYHYTLVLSDADGLTYTQTVIVTVLETTTPTSSEPLDTEPADTTTSTSSEFSEADQISISTPAFDLIFLLSTLIILGLAGLKRQRSKKA